MFAKQPESSPPPAGTERKRSRAGLFLLLYIFAAGGTAGAMARMDNTAEKMGAMSVPLGLLCAGCWYAYKDGGRIARICASFLVLTLVGSFGFGVIKGIEHKQASQEVDAELAKLRSGLSEDFREGELGTESARRHIDRTQAAADRMQASDNSETAALGRAMKSVGELNERADTRLLAALDALDSERFLSVATMLADQDFEWQRATAKEYAAAAEASIESHKGLPDAVKAALAEAGMDSQHAKWVLEGFMKNWPLSGRVYQAHRAAAQSYSALIGFVELHIAEISIGTDDSVEFEQADSASAYNELVERTTIANEKLGAAVDALTRVVSKL